MSKTYVIQWKSKVNGRAGKGTKLFERNEAEQLVQELNHEYPDIQHELLNTEGQVQPAAGMEAQSQQVEEPVEEPSDALSFGE